MALGRMSYVEARNCADELRKSADMIDQYFDRLKVEMNSFAVQDSPLTNMFNEAAANEDSVLQSDAGEKLYEEYTTLEQKLSGYSSKIRDFEVYLRKAVDKYENADATLSKEVG